MDGNIYQQKVQSLSNTLKAFSDALVINSFPIENIRKAAEQLIPVLSGLAFIPEVFKAADRFAESQFVVTERLSRDVVERSKTEDINGLADEQFTSSEYIQKTIALCGLSHNMVFSQAVHAISQDMYNLAITGLTAVLDRVLSEYSEDIKNVNIKKRCDAIKAKVEEKGELFLDELEGRDYLLYLTYPKVAESFGVSSSFEAEEPDLLNRHWIMHGRTDKAYTRLDCVKVLNLIYGTIRLGQLGREDA